MARRPNQCIKLLILKTLTLPQMHQKTFPGIALLLNIVSLCNTTRVHSQILNIDSELHDSLSKKRYLLLSGAFSHDKQKRSINDAELFLELLQKQKNNYAFVLVGQLNTIISGKEIAQNEGFFQIRYRDLDTRKSSIEAYTQYQWNGLWGMRERKLAGMNYRKKILDKKSGDFYAGIGTFYESEIWNYKGVEDPTLIKSGNVAVNRIRLNGYIKAAKKLFSHCDIIAESFLQANALTLENNPSLRWFLLGRINYELSEKVQLSFNYDHIFNQTPVVPIRKLYSGYAFHFNVKL